LIFSDDDTADWGYKENLYSRWYDRIIMFI